MSRKSFAAVAAAALATLLAASPTQAQSAPAATANGVLAAPGGMTLYTFDKDSAGSGTSSCNGPCAQLWPPFAAPSGATANGDWSTLKREDGSLQWAYKGHPLYMYSKDGKAGDMAGDNFKDIWHAAKE